MLYWRLHGTNRRECNNRALVSVAHRCMPAVCVPDVQYYGRQQLISPLSLNMLFSSGGISPKAEGAAAFVSGSFSSELLLAYASRRWSMCQLACLQFGWRNATNLVGALHGISHPVDTHPLPFLNSTPTLRPLGHWQAGLSWREIIFHFFLRHLQPSKELSLSAQVRRSSSVCCERLEVL